jgi:Ca-activated chloride channel family protein
MRPALLVAVMVAAAGAWPRAAQEPSAPQAVFRAGVNMVSMAAVVRDSKGRVVSTLTRNDFEVIDGGQRRALVDLRTEDAAPASVALLVDGSGSMKATAAADAARHVSKAVLLSLDPSRDDAALFSFDTRLLTIRPFTRDLADVGRALAEVESWGSTSLYDAIAGTAGIVSARTANRRAIVVLTDGADTTSSYTPTRVAEIASSVDAPVYAVVWDRRSPESRSVEENARLASLRGLADMTGGELFVVGDDAVMAHAIRKILEELRHQYVLAFEAAPHGGWRSVRVQTRKRGLTVRTRAWYLAGSAD